MCGIFGILELGEYISQQDEQLIYKMEKSLRHRGPDESDYFFSKHFATGCCRLKINGVDNGKQPIQSEYGNTILVCNGEIFNYKELKRSLESKKYRFKTDSDVEVLLYLYEEYGLSMFEHLNGQFAFALYDQRKKQLLIARDHFGVAPLYYYFDEKKQRLIFASEIKGILEDPSVKKEVDLIALDQCLSLPGIVSPRSIFKNINSIKPGHYLVIREEYNQEACYWDIAYNKDSEMSNRSETEYIEELDHLLKLSVQRRLLSEVPVSAYVSGGLDSSLIATIANQQKSGLDSIFSITFEDDFFNEAVFQEIMTDHLNIPAFGYHFKAATIHDHLRSVIWHSETPLKESYNTASYLLANCVNSQGIKVVLSGEGADELFAGYPSYQFADFRNNDEHFFNPDREESNFRKRLWGTDQFFYEKKYQQLSEFKRTLYSPRISESASEIDFSNYPLINKNMIKGLNPLHIRSYIDLKVRIADHLISDHGDRMLMAHSVEGRYPFLDKELVEFITTIPASLKLKDYQGKYILNKVAEKYLPKEIVTREKFGFSAPGSPQLLQEKAEWVEDILSYDRIKREGYFNPKKVDELRKRYSERGFMLAIPYEEDELMPVITFGILKELFQLKNF